MKDILFIVIASFATLVYAEETKPPEKTKTTLTYTTGGMFSWMTVPSGANVGIGKRWYGESFAFGTSANLSASIAVAPFIDAQCECLYFIDENIYVGLQAGLGVGKVNAKNYKYKDIDGVERFTNFPDTAVMPLVKIIPFGMEWNGKNARRFFNLAIFPGGVSFNYGWEI